MKIRITDTQKKLILEGVRPGLFLHSSGGGCVIADPRTIRSLVSKGLAFRKHENFRESLCKAWLTRAAFSLVGATPPERHPFEPNKPWP